jgi:glycosyltransferase involved in cell wall biosynthesis
MKVAFDHQVFLLQEYGGISRYLCNLAAGLNSTPGVSAKVFAPIHRNRNLLEVPHVPVSGFYMPKIPGKAFRIVGRMSEIGARIGLGRYKPDILHETYYSTRSVRPKSCAVVLTVYDMIQEKFAREFRNAEQTSDPKRIAVERADHVICISESTRRDLVELFNVPEEKTSVVYLSADDVFASETPLPSGQNPGGNRPFLLYVGARGGYKNFDGLIRAFARSERLSSEFSVVCFGGGAFSIREKQMMADLGLSDRHVLQIGGNDQTLAGLYAAASAFVYPSKYEGFGIPPLEAMSARCPVLTSNTSSLPEVVGNAGEYFDPDSDESIAAAIENVVLSPSRTAELIRLGNEQRRRFSWDRCVEETIQIYRGIK